MRSRPLAEDGPNQNMNRNKRKSRGAAKKRFAATATGKLKRKRRNHRHILTKKNGKRKRHLLKPALVHESDERRIKLLLG